MNTNMHSEAFHRVLKIVYLHHKQNKRVDHLIHVLLEIARDKAFEQLQKLEKGKNSHRICDINKRHKRAVSYSVLASIQKTGESPYSVSSESTNGITYTVQEVRLSCDCKLKCQFCFACSHMYSCTCLDSCTNTTVCKHIHLVHMQISSSNIRNEPENTQTDLEYFKRVSSVFPTTASPNSKDYTFRKIENRLASILSQCSNCDDVSCLEKICNTLEDVQVYLMENSKYPKKRKSSFQKYQTQRYFYSTRKTRIVPEKLITKPSSDEKQATQLKLESTQTDICAVCFEQDDSSDNKETADWISCSKCSIWVHLNCTTCENEEEYICMYCEQQ